MTSDYLKSTKLSLNKDFCTEIEHYDMLIEEDNDPFYDCMELKDYMNRWDGEEFINSLQLSGQECVLEIGVGTGRLAVKVLPKCKFFTGIDISPKTIERANKNLLNFSNKKLIVGDFNDYNFADKFDVIYSSLTFMHLKNKQFVINKTTSLLNKNGRFVLSIDKNTSDILEFGNRKLRLYPVSPDEIRDCILNAGLVICNEYEKEFAYVFVAKK